MRDTQLRKKTTGKDAAAEFQLVIEDVFDNRWKKDSELGECLVLKKDEDTSQQQQNGCEESYERSQLKITLKVFLRDFSPTSLRSSVEKSLAELGVDSVDSLFLAVPSDAQPLIGLGSAGRPNAPDHTEAVDALVELWREIEQMAEAGKLTAAGLCDLRPAVFIAVYNQAVRKPQFIQINLKSCCVIPEELNEFAIEQGVSVLTHSDPGELVSEDQLRTVLFPHLGREAGHYTPTWISRYLVQVKDRGVLREKRYLVQLSK